MREIHASNWSSRPDDATYFRRRARQEQIAAQKARCEAARNRHDQLAAMYRFRALMSSGEPTARSKPSSGKAFETVS
jgi:hypothetical protein